MRFAINYAPQAAELLRQGQIKLDYFKTLPWLDWVLEKVRSGAWGQIHMLAFEYGGIGEF